MLINIILQWIKTIFYNGTLKLGLYQKTNLSQIEILTLGKNIVWILPVSN
jgi:hypothetical protein